jgi:predicted nucleic acid-binding protein
MIILDNSVLSAFTRLNLLSLLKELLSPVYISKDIFTEYTKKWQKKIPTWVKIVEASERTNLKISSSHLSKADLSLIKLSLEYKLPIASDDKPLRIYAKKRHIPITGSIGLLKSLYKNNIITNYEEYRRYLFLLKKDLYISDILMDWALDL